MKNYCIIIPDFTGVGGAQLYAIRRANYLINSGYNVYFLVNTFDDSKIGVPKNIKVIFNVLLNDHLFLFSKSIIEAKYYDFIKNIKNPENTTIESFSIESATWGEYFAYRMNCKHFLYALGEPPLDNFRHKYLLKFLLFKYHRGELLGLSKPSLKIIMGRFYEENFNNFVNIAFDENEITEKTSPNFLEGIDRNSIVITTVSRLVKSYIQVLIDDTLKLAQKYPEKKFTLIICGENTGKGLNSEFLRKKYAVHDKINNKPNLHFVIPGYTYPLGRDLFKISDVFVGMGTAAVNSISQSCATICVDPRVDKSIGIFGLETDFFAYPEDGKYYEIADSIEKLLLDQEIMQTAKTSGRKLFLAEYEYISCMKKIDNYIILSESKKEYFSFQPKSLIDFMLINLAIITAVLKKNPLFIKVFNKLK